MVKPTSDGFTKYKGLMGLNLKKFYKIEYNNNTRGNVSDYEWSEAHFFHGTGHCGCVDR